MNIGLGPRAVVSAGSPFALTILFAVATTPLRHRPLWPYPSLSEPERNRTGKGSIVPTERCICISQYPPNQHPPTQLPKISSECVKILLHPTESLMEEGSFGSHNYTHLALNLVNDCQNVHGIVWRMKSWKWESGISTTSRTFGNVTQYHRLLHLYPLRHPNRHDSPFYHL